MSNNSEKKRIVLVTGACGFIGSHVCERFLNDPGTVVIGIDNMNSLIYDKKYKLSNKQILQKYPHYIHIEADILSNNNWITYYKPSVVIHLAAHANVRKSTEYANEFIQNNLGTTQHLLEEIAHMRPADRPLFLYASSSSIYGNNKTPFSEEDQIENILCTYALSKYFCEQMVDFYCNEYQMDAVGFRFFSVYGPRCRPDMATYQIMTLIHNEKTIKIMGYGSISRDFTYIYDIVDLIYAGATNKRSQSIPAKNHQIYNLGNSKPITLRHFISKIEEIAKKEATIELLPRNKNDALITFSDISKACSELGYQPKIDIDEGLRKTYEWIVSKNNEQVMTTEWSHKLHNFYFYIVVEQIVYMAAWVIKGFFNAVTGRSKNE